MLYSFEPVMPAARWFRRSPYLRSGGAGNRLHRRCRWYRRRIALDRDPNPSVARLLPWQSRAPTHVVRRSTGCNLHVVRSLMAIGAQQAAIRTVIASALAEHANESGRSVDALFAM